jgi:hypothetical protein
MIPPWCAAPPFQTLTHPSLIHERENVQFQTLSEESPSEISDVLYRHLSRAKL